MSKGPPGTHNDDLAKVYVLHNSTMRGIVDVWIHPRIRERHPELTDEDVQTAVRNSARSQPRLDTDPVQYAGIGFDASGRQIQWVGTRDRGTGGWRISHAMTPATKKMIKELEERR
jgi:hypothetical protein